MTPFRTDKAYWINLIAANPVYPHRWQDDELIVEQGSSLDIVLGPITAEGYYYSEVRLRFENEQLVAISIDNYP